MPFLYHPLAAPQLLGPSPLVYSPLPILQRAPTAVTTSLYPTPTASPFNSSQPQQPQRPQQQRDSEQQQQPTLTQQQQGILQPCLQQTSSLQHQELFTNKVISYPQKLNTIRKNVRHIACVKTSPCIEVTCLTFLVLGWMFQGSAQLSEASFAGDLSESRTRIRTQQRCVRVSPG